MCGSLLAGDGMMANGRNMFWTMVEQVQLEDFGRLLKFIPGCLFAVSAAAKDTF